MTDSDSSDMEVVIVPQKPPSKRRRIIDPTSISTVPIYSNKVNKCLQLKPEASVLAENNTGENAEPKLWSATTKICIELSEEEEENEVYICSSPPPLPSECSARKMSRRVNRKINEVNRKIGAVSSLLSPTPESKGRRSRRGHVPSPPTSSPFCQPAPAMEESVPATSREIPLKFRCRTDLLKIHVLSSAPLSKAVDELSVKLKVPPSRILLLRRDMALSTHSTVTELGLGIADIIDCVVTAADNSIDCVVTAKDDRRTTSGGDVITVRLQGKEKGSSQEFSLHREKTLGSILSQYLSNMAAGHKVHFRYDGSKITPSQTPAQLDMEDGDVIEVWT